jgi:hypothetical protein
MKKSGVTVLIALLLGVIAFALMAAPCCTIYENGNGGNVFDYAFGSSQYKQEADFLFVFLPILFGLIFLAIVGLCKLGQQRAASSVFCIFAAIAFLIGGIAFFNARNIMAEFAATQNRSYSADQYKSVLSLNAGPIMGGIACLASAILACVTVGLTNQESSLAAPNRTVTYAATAKPMESTAKTDTLQEKAEALKQYKALLDEGVITQEEFDQKKAELLK